ncbi:tail tape measure protein [Streptococcus phage Str-PAP-1]|uniref:tail length tape measure protein n=1 Tax=Streptococcus phage Str-PAP-1 TaxID=1589270 RepID=UPI000588E5E2|nr:tail length tape measure protein [Streptococcus phage Str-PAP-1]AJD83088.1 tail tape measure protein [Streptococcus phage Str-PAP-1]
MERLLTDAEKLTGKKYDMSNLSDVYSAIHAVQKEIGITGTTAKEAEHTFSGSLSAMKASASNLLGKLALGEDIRPSLEQLANTTYTFFIGNFIPMVGNIFKGIGSMFQIAFTELIPQMISEMDAQMPNFITKGGELIGNLLVGVMQALPSLIEGLGNILISFQQYLYENYPVIMQAGANLILRLVDGIVANLPAVIQSAVNVISKFIDMISQNLPTVLKKGVEIIGKLVAGIIQRLPDITNAVIKIIGILLQGIISNFPKIINAGVQIIISLVKGIASAVGKVISEIGQLGQSIISKISSVNLMQAGIAIIQGFLDGLKSKYQEVQNFVGGIASWISEHKGPIEYDRKLLIPHGNAIMDGLNKGLKDNFKNVKSSVSGMADELQSAFGTPQLATDMPVNMQSQISGQLSSNRLAYQLSNSSQNELSNFDLFNAINGIKDRQIVVSVQVDKREAARLIAQPVDEEITKQKNALSRTKGEL